MVEIPTTEINGDKWILLSCLDKKITFRAVSIGKVRRISDPSDHRVCETIAEGSVKCKPRSWNISQFKL